MEGNNTSPDLIPPYGFLAQPTRALHLHCRGQGFESPKAHKIWEDGNDQSRECVPRELTLIDRESNVSSTLTSLNGCCSFESSSSPIAEMVIRYRKLKTKENRNKGVSTGSGRVCKTSPWWFNSICSHS